jgi:retron-type reverse transcriptase
MPVPPLVAALARSIAAGAPTIEQIVARASRTLGRRWRWLRPLARRYVHALAGRTRPHQRDVVQFLLRDAGFRRARSKYSTELSVDRWLPEPQRMQPVPAAATWRLPAIESPGALADWLLLDHSELEWFADLKGFGYKSNRPRLRHYRYQVRTKRSGAIRLIEAPKVRLKKLQRQILAGILAAIPPHPAAHGFTKGRSIKTFVAPHVGQRVVLRMDLQDFFPSIAGVRIQALFRTMGYPASVADLLGAICTNATPRDAWSGAAAYDVPPPQLREARALYARPHLPQGAPTSPALANLCAYRVDCRLAGLAKSVGAGYTRYADDLAFSGGEAFERCVERFATHVAAILHEEGFSVHHRKTRIMRQGVRQHLAGLVANRRMNVMRADFDRLKAILTNCVRLGPQSQNRDAHPYFRAHLEGRVGFVESINPGKGRRLRAILDQIQWQ